MRAVVVPATEQAEIIATLYSGRSRRPRLSRQLRILASLLVAWSHALVIVAVLMFARLHDVLLATPRMRHDLVQFGASLIDFFPIVQVVCYVAAVVHATSLLHTARSLVRFAIRAPRRMISALSRGSNVSTIETINHRRVDTTAAIMSASALAPISYWRHWADRVNRFSVTYLVEISQARLLVEIALQTFQANKLSQLTETVWLNRLLACVIIVNCWFSPIIRIAMRTRSEYAKRVVRLVSDTVLDAVYSFGIPAVILYPYWRDYIPANGAFPLPFYVTDTWMIVAEAEMRQVFVSSWLDLVSKALPWFFFCYRLQALRRLLSFRVSSRKMPSSRAKTSLSRLLDAVLTAWGFVVLGLHVQVTWVAESTSTQGCLVELRPWFRTSYTCTVLELSCSQRQIIGRQEEIALALAKTDVSQIRGLIISNCPSLEMPPTMQTLTMLSRLKFYNSTITEWPIDAALTKMTNPTISQFFAVRTNFTQFPDGLLAPEFPTSMKDVKFVATNLTTLPLSFSEAWGSIKYLVMELNPSLREVPEAVSRLTQLAFLDMSGNAIVHVPDTLLKSLTVVQVWFINNPLTVIPSAVGQFGMTRGLEVGHTKVMSLPTSWLASRDDLSLGEFSIYAESTPLCDALQQQRFVGSDPSGPAEFRIGRFRIVCEENGAALKDTLYPIVEEDAWRQANRFFTPVASLG